MTTTLYAGNAKTVALAEQTDKATPAAEPTIAFDVYEFTKTPARSIDAIEESDASAQQGGSHVTAITPGLTFGIFGRPDALHVIAYALLGDSTPTPGTGGDPNSHLAVPVQDQPYYTIWEVLPYGTVRWDGCRLGAATFTAQDSGDTKLRVTGMQWQALGIKHGEAAPDLDGLLPTEQPFIFAELAVKYGGVHLGTTVAFTWTVNRNPFRAQGDSGFKALDVVALKLQNDGSVTRYTQDDDMMRALDTGTAAGTDPTVAIFEESLEMTFHRGADADERSFQIVSQGVAYEGREEALNPDGAPYQEVLAFRTQPQDDIADNVSMVTLNQAADV